MKINHFSFNIGLCLALGSPLLLLGTAPQAKAQSNLSDVTGPIMTTSDMVGYGSRIRRREIVFRTDRIRTSVYQAATSFISLLQAGNLVVANISISANVQQALLVVLTGTGDVQASANQLVNGLISPPQPASEQKGQTGKIAQGSDRTRLAQKLVSSLIGLTPNGKVDAAKLRTAVAAYNAFINSSSGDYLSNPPQEFLAIQSVMSTLLNAALTAA